MEGDEQADRENGGKTTLESGLALNGTSYYGRLKAKWGELSVTSPVVPQQSARQLDR